MRGKLLLLLFLGFIVRLLVIPQPGFEADVAYWKSWSLAASTKGIYWLVNNTNYNYPSGFALILWAIGKIYSFFADPNNYLQYWQAGNYLYLLLIKLPSIIADLVASACIFYLISKPNLLGFSKNISKFALPASALYLLHPAIIFDGAWWGQVDSLGIMFTFLCLTFTVLKKPLLASLFLTLGFQTKLQTMIFFPLFFLYIWRAFSWKEMVKTLVVSFVTFIVTSFPFVIANDMGKTFRLIIQNADWFPQASLRAFNLWWLATDGNGMQTSDKILTLGITTAKTAGLIIFSTTYFLLGGLIARKPSNQHFLVTLLLASFSFFLFPTQSHERYILPALAIIIPVLPIIWDNTYGKIISLIIFIIFSFNVLLGLNMSMVANYPDNGLPGLSQINQPILGIVISILNLSIFVILFYLLVLRHLNRLLVICGAGLITAGFLLTNLSYLSKDSLPLSQLKPISYQQDYGGPQMNMSVNSVFGPKYWSPLSNNYYFFRRGIGSHANSIIQYDLAKKFRRFSTQYGVDTGATVEASVIFQILADNKLIFTSERMGKFDLPESIELDIAGVESLSLVTNNAGDGINGDHADWLEPTLYK